MVLGGCSLRQRWLFWWTSALPRSQKYRSNVYSLEFGSHHCCRTLFGGWWRWVGAGMRWGGFPENSWSLRLCGWNPPWDPNCPPSRYTKVAAFLIRTSMRYFLRMVTQGQGGLVGGNDRGSLTSVWSPPPPHRKGILTAALSLTSAPYINATAIHSHLDI